MIKMFCANCDMEIPIGSDFIEVVIIIKEWNGSTDDLDSKDNEYNDYCEDCVENCNLSKILLAKLNKRNPDPDRMKK